MADITGKDLLEIGLKGGPDFGKILAQAKEFPTKEEALEFAKTFVKVEQPKAAKKPFVSPGSVFEWLLNGGRHLVPDFLESDEVRASNSSIKRLLENRSVIINGFAPPADASIDNQWPIWELIFFPKGKRRTTIFSEAKTEIALWYDCEGNLLEQPCKTYPSNNSATSQESCQTSSVCHFQTMI